mmetsp:Transcript_21991/g.72790  ORF Transcript_21991/g.72790 Transcript_21991/m.72790 type:complete len:770 (-) Transcript_21991:12-2321(-)
MAVAVPTLARLLALLAAHHATARIGTHARPLQLRGGAKKLRGGSEDEAPAPRKVGCLIVGLGGNNGCTVLAGLVANRRRLAWEGQKRRIDADWGGCLTQRGDLAEKMASFEHAAVGGWDVRPTKLGAALLAARIVDTDLARLVEAELDAVEVMPGVYDERYVGESQRATATHTKQGLATAKEKVDALRADIRRFKEAHGVDGHCTVIWSASVEPPSLLPEAAVATADALLDMLAGPLEYDAPPSLLYAVAAALEGCSFVNGGSQDTVCDGLAELCERKGAYALGTDFKAGQTKFKTCAVEYLESNGFTVKVVASSNHLGNNDMRNLALGTPTQARTNAAKLRVKSSIFKPGVDHHVSVQYAPFIGDEKRDFVEYTSEAFLGQLHTMATYTRCSDSVLCAPLLVDATVLLDFFATHAVAPAEVAEATAYLFKVPEGRAKAEAQGFHAQLDTMKRTVAAVEAAEEDVEALVEEVEALVVDKEEPLVEQEDGNEAPAEREAEDTPKPEEAPSKPAVVCCGLACLDLELGGASDGGREAINGFEAATFEATLIHRREPLGWYMLSRDRPYDITHEIFALTDDGRFPFPFLAPADVAYERDATGGLAKRAAPDEPRAARYFAYALQTVVDLLKLHVKRDELDIVCEYVVNLGQLGVRARRGDDGSVDFALGELYLQGRDYVASRRNADGTFGDTYDQDAVRSAKQNRNYDVDVGGTLHTTYVCLWALTQPVYDDDDAQSSWAGAHTTDAEHVALAEASGAEPTLPPPPPPRPEL